MVELFISEGTASEHAEKRTNTTGEMTPILASVLDRGTFARIRNQVRKGDEIGIPVYADLRDTNGDPLPVNTSVQFEIKVAGKSRTFKVSKEMRNISVYNSQTIKEQRNSDNVDSVKMVLTQPEANGGQKVPFVDFRDIDEFRVSIDSAAQIDWANSELYIDPAGLEGPKTRDGR